MITHTRESVRLLIESRIESDMPDRVLASLKKFDGKPITMRIEKHMNAVEPTSSGLRWRLMRHYGWTSLKTLYVSSAALVDGRYNVDLMLARSEGAVPLDLAWVEKENGGYFEARRERNRKRVETINSFGTLNALALAMNDAEAAMVRYADVKSRYTDLARGLPDDYELQKACGLMDPDCHDFGDRNYRRDRKPRS